MAADKNRSKKFTRFSSHTEEQIALDFINLVEFQRTTVIKQSRLKSGDDERSLCQSDWSSSEPPNYSSTCQKLREAVAEAEGSCDFAGKVLYILATTVLVTILLGTFSVIPAAMLTIGVKYLHECPVEPKLPVYLMVGGSFGLLKTISLLWTQIRSRRYERLDDVYLPNDTHDDVLVSSRSSQFSDFLLSLFLLCWFVCGNYWVFHIWPPHYEQLLYDPDNWCDRTVYMFCFGQIIGTYILAGTITVICIILAICHRCILYTS